MKKDEEKTKNPEYSQEQIDEAIKWIQELNCPSSIRELIIYCLKTVSSVNALLLKSKVTISKFKKIFGIKTEKKSPKKAEPLQHLPSRKKKMLMGILKKSRTSKK